MVKKYIMRGLMIPTPHLTLFGGIPIEKNEVGRACSPYGERRGVYGVWVGKAAGKRPLGRPRHRWEDNIELDLQ